MSSRFAIILAAIVIIFSAFFVVNKNKSHTNGVTGSTSTAQASNHIEGSTKTGVTLVEYGDYECPACTAYYPIVKQVVDTYKDRIQFQFVNFPLYQIHQNAMVAHRAAEAAGMQGKYWEMHDLLYTNHDQWANSSNPTDSFNSYAQQLGLNLTKFKQDFASSTVNDIINADLAKGNKLGVDATPTFYLDGKKIEQNPQSVADFNKLIDQEIANKTKS